MSVYPETKRSRPETWLATTWALILRVVVAAAVGYVLYRVRLIIVVVLMAVMLAFAAAPLVDWLRTSRVLRPVPHRLRRGVATTMVFAVLALALVELGFLILRPMAEELKAIAANWKTYQAEWAMRVHTLQERYNALPPDIRQWIEEQGLGDLGTRVGGQVQEVIRRTVESGMVLVEMILVPVLAFSFLTESRPLKKEFVSLLPRSRLRDGLYVLQQTGAILQSYTIGQIILAVIAGSVVWLLMVMMGLRYPLAMAVVAAITRVIPVIGPVVGAIPIVLLSTLQGWERGLAVLVALCIMHLVESKVVMPRLIGHRIKLHPAVVIIVLLIGAEFFGMWGMFLAAPVAAVVKMLLYHFFVRPRIRYGDRLPALEAGTIQEGKPSERPAVAGVRGHSGAH